MKLFLAALSAIAISLTFSACKTAKSQQEEVSFVMGKADTKQYEPVKPVNYIPKARIFTLNGDYADHVPVGMNPDHTVITSFPAPTDINANSAPIPLANGFYLDRRGVSYDSGFTRWTYDQYAKLPQVPSMQQLMLSVIPEARVTRIVELPITTQKAIRDTAAINEIIRNDFKGLDSLKGK
ncbi:MAG: hypothetical protein HUK13_09775 [Muribaculaceae bacterium]|nr:hypothetical protein [Muribaculaceae bacterium]MCF0214700.1 hypothetical protein [Muribaculaceae bacterium]